MADLNTTQLNDSEKAALKALFPERTIWGALAVYSKTPAMPTTVGELYDFSPSIQSYCANNFWAKTAKDKWKKYNELKDRIVERAKGSEKKEEDKKNSYDKQGKDTKPAAKPSPASKKSENKKETDTQHLSSEIFVHGYSADTDLTINGKKQKLVNPEIAGVTENAENGKQNKKLSNVATNAKGKGANTDFDLAENVASDKLVLGETGDDMDDDFNLGESGNDAKAKSAQLEVLKSYLKTEYAFVGVCENTAYIKNLQGAKKESFQQKIKEYKAQLRENLQKLTSGGVVSDFGKAQAYLDDFCKTQSPFVNLTGLAWGKDNKVGEYGLEDKMHVITRQFGRNCQKNDPEFATRFNEAFGDKTREAATVFVQYEGDNMRAGDYRATNNADAIMENAYGTGGMLVQHMADTDIRRDMARERSAPENSSSR